MTRENKKAERNRDRQDQLKQAFQTTNESEYETVTGARIGRAVVMNVKVCSKDKGLYLAEFDGNIEEMTHAEALQRNNEYLIYLRQGVYLNCARSAANGRCRASMVNTPRGLLHHVTGNEAVNNVSLVVHGDRAWLCANGTEIPQNGEVFFGYGNGFRIPL
jgi:hypothetical protein